MWTCSDKLLTSWFIEVHCLLRSLHKCMDNCPGGKPGTCAAGLEGRTCAACPGAQVWRFGTTLVYFIRLYTLVVFSQCIDAGDITRKNCCGDFK